MITIDNGFFVYHKVFNEIVIFENTFENKFETKLDRGGGCSKNGFISFVEQSKQTLSVKLFDFEFFFSIADFEFLIFRNIVGSVVL